MVNAQMEGWNSFCWEKEDTNKLKLCRGEYLNNKQSAIKMLELRINLLKWLSFIKQHIFL